MHKRTCTNDVNASFDDVNAINFLELVRATLDRVKVFSLIRRAEETLFFSCFHENMDGPITLKLLPPIILFAFTLKIKIGIINKSCNI